jgi:hypothetical protein
VSNKRKGYYPSDDDPQYAHLKNAKGTPTEAEKIEERTAQRAKANLKERFVKLPNDLTASPAWKQLGSYARDAYVRIVRRARFNKQGRIVNNGEIPMAVRELAEEMAVARTTAHLALIRLQLFGFLREGRKGHFGSTLSPRRSTRWILTEHATADALATREYLNIDIRNANKRYAKREFDLRRKKSCVTPRGTQNAFASPHGVRTRHPTGDTDGSKSSNSEQLRHPTGDSLETSHQGGEHPSLNIAQWWVRLRPGGALPLPPRPMPTLKEKYPHQQHHIQRSPFGMSSSAARQQATSTAATRPRKKSWSTQQHSKNLESASWQESRGNFHGQPTRIFPYGQPQSAGHAPRRPQDRRLPDGRREDAVGAVLPFQRQAEKVATDADSGGPQIGRHHHLHS